MVALELLIIEMVFESRPGALTGNITFWIFRLTVVYSVSVFTFYYDDPSLNLAEGPIGLKEPKQTKIEPG